MKQLYLARCQSLGEYQSKDAEHWASIFKVIGLNVSLVDRTGYIKMPFNFKTYDGFEMPDINNSTFNLSYEECCNLRAQELIQLSAKLNKPINVMYSGGIDSTLVLISLIKNINPTELRDRIIVSMTTDSIVENPNFYYNYIRKNFKIVSSDNVGSFLDGKSIVVGGEHNDQLFGSDLIGKIYREFDFTNIHSKYSREFITTWFISRGMSKESANIWYDLLDQQIKSVAPANVVTNAQFFWWLNFCFKWQSVFFRILARVDVNRRSLITHNFINNYFHHFYSTTEFQKWSMINSDKKVIESWSSYKTEAKNVIYDFNKDSQYRDNKVKIGSLYRLFVQRNSAEAIDSDLSFIAEGYLNAEDFYNSNNSFI